jgi:hypothetical protein
MEKHVKKKADIVQVISDFALIHKKPVSLFGKLKSRILAQLDVYTANDLGAVCHGWARLGFLKEDFLVAISERIAATASEASTDALVHLLDGYATTRLNVEMATKSINTEISARVEDMQAWQVALHMSSLARLNAKGEQQLLTLLANRSISTISDHTARDLALVVYSLGKLGCDSVKIGKNFNHRSLELVRDFTAKELEMVATGFARLGNLDAPLFQEISVQATRRIAQFSGGALAGLARAFSRVARPEMFLHFVTRAMVEMPRITAHMEYSEAQELSRAFEKLGVQSDLLDHCTATRKSVDIFETSEAVATSIIGLAEKPEEISAIEQIEVLCQKLEIGKFDAGRAAEVYCALAKLEGWRSSSVAACMQSLMQRALSKDL